jgi:hypothetical protein
MKKISAILIALTLLLGCESTENKLSEVKYVTITGAKESASSTPSPAPRTDYGYVDASKSVNMDAFVMRNYLYANEDMPSTHYSLFIFSRRPVVLAEYDRYRLICNLWKGMYSSYDSKVVLPANTKLVPFYWMLKKKETNTDCSNLVENYDYERAHFYILAEDLDPNSMYIVFEIPSGLVKLDLSRIKSEEDLILAMEVWKKKMTHIPKEETNLTIYTIGYSAKLLLGALGDLIAMK